MEEEIQASLDEELLTANVNMTVYELVERYIAQKRGVRENTETGYRFIMNILRKERFGMLMINRVRLSDAKLWLIKLQKDGRGYSSIHAIRGVLRPAFQMAMDDDLILKNPFAFELTTVIVNDSVTRVSLTAKQEQAFLDFVRNDSHFSRYYDGIFLLFKTGMRISEFCGLTLKDIDFAKRRITVDHQLQRSRLMNYYIEEPKTSSGRRILPMTNEVYQCCRRIVENRKAPRVEPMVDGRVGFLYLDMNDRPMVALHWQHYFKRIREKYDEAGGAPMPIVTPHVCRHTFCSNMARNGMNPKTLQYLMGHADVSLTLNTYTHVDYDDVLQEVLRVANPQK
jgi:integrase